MAGVKERLARKYGLLMSPSPEEITAWEDRIQTLMEQGLPLEAAGEVAARQTFVGYGMNPSTEKIRIETVLPLDLLQIWPTSTSKKVHALAGETGRMPGLSGRQVGSRAPAVPAGLLGRSQKSNRVGP